MRLDGANPARVPAIRLGERSSVGASLVAGADGVMICDPADGVTWAVPEDINDGRLPTHQGDAHARRAVRGKYARELVGLAARLLDDHPDSCPDGDLMEPLSDSDVPAWWQRLGLPGLVDIHTHFLPERMMRRVWTHFDEAGPLIGRTWPIEYRWDQDRRLAHLRRLGVRHFTALTYAHKAGMAGDLTDFALDLSTT